jgi:hypothetical protein
LITHASRNVVFYFASDDLAQCSSKYANLQNRIVPRRHGHSSPEEMERTPRNMFQADRDHIDTANDIPLGHNYSRYGCKSGQPGKVFNHIFQFIALGRVFPEAPHQRTFILNRIRSWA